MLVAFWAAAGAGEGKGPGSPEPTCSRTQAPLYLQGVFAMALSHCGQITDLAAACRQLRSSG